MRGLFIGLGAALVQNFHWVLYVFGAFLVYTGIRLFVQDYEVSHPDENRAVLALRRFVPVTEDYEGQRFVVTRRGRRFVTPLMVVLVAIETSDVVFAIDSIPAIFAITTDPFIVYTSNIFAILGLRALYFLLADMMSRFRYLKHGLAFILSFVGAKMLAADVYEIPITASLAIIAFTLAVSVAVSLSHSDSAEASGGTA
jgi:tellurite resistance protein TerC